VRIVPLSIYGCFEKHLHDDFAQGVFDQIVRLPDALRRFSNLSVIALTGISITS
jgi:hypothetical protein